jgi:hypothetical protein
MHMRAVSGAGIDGQIRVMLPHDLGHSQRVLDIVDGEHKGGRLVGAGRAQDVEAPGIAIVDLGAEAPHEIHLLDIGVERGEGNAPGSKHARYDLPEAPKSRDNDVVIAGRRRFVFRGRGLVAPIERIVEEQEQRRQRHGQCHGKR